MVWRGKNAAPLLRRNCRANFRKSSALETPASREPSGKKAAGGSTAISAYGDVPGLCRTATLKEIEAQGWSLNPGRYAGVAAGETA